MKTTTTFLSCLFFLLGMNNQAISQFDFTNFNISLKLAKASTGGGGGGTQKPPEKPDRDGGGTGNFINANWPKTGKLVKKSTTFTWSDEEKGPYIFKISSGNENIFKSEVNMNTINVDLNELNTSPNKEYNIVVEKADASKSSRETILMMHSKVDLEEDIKALEEDDTYKSTEGVEKELMKAFYLEQKQWNLEAENAYHIETKDPQEMNLILQMYFEFLSRT